MDKLKQWVALTLVGIMGVAAAGWFLLISPKRSEAADLRTQASDQESTNAGLRNQLAALKAKAAALPREQAKLAAVAQKIPDNPALPGLIRALTAASDGAGVEFISLAPGAPTAPGAATAAAGAATAAGLQVVPLTITVSGGYFGIEQFTAALEDLPRAVRLTVLNLVPGESPLAAKTGGSGAAKSGDNLNVSITAEAYMAAPASAATAATTTTPVAGTATTPVAASSSTPVVSSSAAPQN